MLLLLLMYLAPFVAMALYWYAQRGAGDTTGWSALEDAAVGRSAYFRPAAAALLFAAVLVTGSVGLRGGVAFVVGAALAVFAAALAYSASTAAVENAAARLQPEATNVVWTASCAIALAPAAVVTGCVGALAWFFADPAGAAVLAAFAAGSSAGALFLSMTVLSATVLSTTELSTTELSGNMLSGTVLSGTVLSGTVAMAGQRPADGDSTDGASPRSAVPSPRSAVMWARSAVTSATTAAMHSHLSAVAAVMMVASTAEPEGLLSLGGLLAETETLRSELLLLPIAISILSPMLALMVGPLVSTLLERRRATTIFDVERFAAVLACLMMLVLVMASGLAWVVAAAFAAGVAARHLAVVADEASIRSAGVGRREMQSMLPALLAAAALACGEQLAGWYGITLAALGMTATFASAAACAIARELNASMTTPTFRGEFGIADSTVTVTTTLALLVAMAPVIVAESSHRGAALTLVATAAPALLLGVMIGAVAAATLSQRYVEADNEGDAVNRASRAVALATGIPAVAGMLLGAGAAVGMVLGFLAWAAVTAPLAGVAGSPESSCDRMPRSVMLSWGRTMAIAALVSVPMMK